MIRAAVVAGCATALAVVALTQSPQQPVEDAYRANNLGVARLEQFDYPAAAAAFRQALEKHSDLAVARLNLAIALFYAGDLTAARREAESAAARLPSLPQPPYVLGLIARAENRTADAVSAFTRVRELDADDPGAATQLGQLLLQDRKYAEAIDLFKRAIAAEPYNATAAYGLAMALTRGGSRDEGAAAMAQFQKLRDSAYATTYSQNYLEQGRYAGAIASTGAEPELVDQSLPAVTFTDATATILPEARKPGSVAGDGSVTLVDLDGDGDLDLIDVDPGGLRLYRNDRGRFRDRTGGATFGAGTPRRVVAGAFDNDFLPDLLVLYESRWSLFRQAENRFEEVKGLPAGPASPHTAAWLDADHDGDLDALVGGSAAAGGALLLARNNGDGTFTDITATAGLKMQAAVDTAAATDYDNRRDVDVLLGSHDGRPLLLRNMRDGTFRDIAADAGLTATGRVVALGDVNKDDYTDILVARAGAAALALSDGHGRFRVEAVEAGSDVRAAQFLDYDNDGLLDLFTLTSTAPRLLRNVGSGRWMDVTDRALGAVPAATYSPGSLATGDLDGDGDVDVILRPARGAPIVLRNDGGSAKRSLRVRLIARVSNRSALGSKIEIRAGSLRQKIETSAATPAVAPADVLFGLGARAAADVVRVLWPAGILQAEIPPAPSEIALTVHELDRKPSSCPYLYTWNGERFEFITDFLGGGELGYFVAPGVRSRPDPDEYVRIDGRQLKERDGRYELRVTNELEETLFLDRTRLLAIDHPAEVEIYPDEGLKALPPAFRLHAIRDAVPLTAIDDHGHDVSDRVARLDRRYPDDFALERIRGYAAEHSLTLRLPETRPARSVLLLTGWTDYAFSSDNFAASQAGLRLVPPFLEIKDADGRWRTAIADVGVPVGRPQTVVVDLSEPVPPSARDIRISTTMRIYWDQIRIAASEAVAPFGHFRVLEPISADLRWRGFSAESTREEPYRYDYATVSSASPWKIMPGRYTRQGDVRPLLGATDDMFVVARPGDEIALAFDARELRPLRPGHARTFLLHADGFSKEMNLHSSSPDVVEPLPFHGMPEYPYSAPHAYPSSDAHRAYLERYNTRIVNRMLPPLIGDKP